MCGMFFFMFFIEKTTIKHTSMYMTCTPTTKYPFYKDFQHLDGFILRDLDTQTFRVKNIRNFRSGSARPPSAFSAFFEVFFAFLPTTQTRWYTSPALPYYFVIR